jgi:general secretion pathway protein F
MLYPAIVSVIALVIVTFLVTYVVPQVASVFTSSKRALPCAHRGHAGHSVASCGNGAGRWPWRWPAAACLAGAGTLPRRRPFRERSDALLADDLPLVGRLARGYNAARFGGTLAMLAGAGVPILKALQAAAETLGNRAMRADALDALVLVREGAPLASRAGRQKSAFRACWRCSRAWVSRPASCR